MFRPVYQSELDIDKLQLVDGRTPAAVSAFKAAHERFLTTLEELIEEVESG